MSATYKDCPQDIRTLSAHIVANFGADPALLEGAIAAALDSEREACALIVEVATEQGGGATHLSYAGPDIASAIRKRGA